MTKDFDERETAAELYLYITEAGERYSVLFPVLTKELRCPAMQIANITA